MGLKNLIILSFGLIANFACTHKSSMDESVSQDGPRVDPIVCCESFGYGSQHKKCCETYERVKRSMCETPHGMVGGGKQMVDDAKCRNR